jgi:5-methylcytosine-specific restriction endonuclease McrA
VVIRRYSPIKKSAGTVIPPKVRDAVKERDRYCVGPRVGMAEGCYGGLELDHVRASGGIGMKSPSTPENLVTLCATHHREKTEHGRIWRPRLMAYLEGQGIQGADPYAVELAQRTGKP